VRLTQCVLAEQNRPNRLKKYYFFNILLMRVRRTRVTHQFPRAPVAESVTTSPACRVRVQPTVDVLVSPVLESVPVTVTGVPPSRAQLLS
jgi:hypothetical protein